MRITTLLIFLFLFNVFFTARAQTHVNRVVISGTIKNANNSIPILDLGEFGQLTPADPEMLILPDSTGEFSISFSLLKAGYFKIGRNVVYLSPGDKLNASLDYREPLDAKFSGSHSKEDDYLKGTPLPHAGSYLDGGYQIKRSLQATNDNIINLSNTRKGMLASQHFSPLFVLMETARIKADIVNSLLKIKLYFPLLNKLKGDSLVQFKTAYAETVPPLIDKYEKELIDPRYLNLEVYTYILPDILSKTGDAKSDLGQLKNWVNATDLADSLNKAVDKTSIKKYGTQINQTVNIRYRPGLKKVYDNKVRFGNGDLARNFQAENIKGEIFNLSDFKNKIIIIDLWATWCVPCLTEMPYFESLAKDYKDNREVVFLSISVDYDKVQWKKKVKDALNIIALNSTSGSLMRVYSVLTIPRTIIIDGNFKVAEMAGPKPSAKAFKAYIDELIRKADKL